MKNGVKFESREDEIYLANPANFKFGTEKARVYLHKIYGSEPLKNDQI